MGTARGEKTKRNDKKKKLIYVGIIARKSEVGQTGGSRRVIFLGGVGITRGKKTEQEKKRRT